MVDTDDDASAGWAAIDAALARLYPTAKPQHFGTMLKWMLGGPDPLDGISFYQREDHWHIVSYGMSELYDKQSENAEHSGWGFEFTFRVARAQDETEPPVWAANFLQNLARYVFNSSNAFAPGHHVDLNGPISLARPDTQIRAITFAEDPELGSIDTPHGRLGFLQIVGITLDEYAVIEQWDTTPLLAPLAPDLPLLVTDLGRRSLIGNPRVADAIAEGIRRDGSATGSLYVEHVGWRIEDPDHGSVELTFGASVVERIGRVLAGRLPHGRGLSIDGSERGIRFRSGERLTVTENGDGYLYIELPAEVLSELVDVLRPTAGTYCLSSAPNLTVQVVRSQIRDGKGNVVQEIG